MKMQRVQDGQAAARRSKPSAAPGGVSGKVRPAGGRLLALLRRGDEGQALVEAALVLAIVVLPLMTGIFSLGLAFSNQQALTQAVGIGATVLSESRHATTDPCADTYSAITGNAPQLNPATIGLTITMNGTAVAGNSCSGDETDLLTSGGGAGQVSVTGTYPCSIGVYGVNLVPGCQLKATVTEFEY